MKRIGVALLPVCFALLPFLAQAQTPLPSIAEKTKGFDRRDGFVPLHWDRGEGRLWLEIPSLETELLYITSVRGPRLERHRPRSRAARGEARRLVSSGRQEGAAGRTQLRVPGAE